MGKTAGNDTASGIRVNPYSNLAAAKFWKTGVVEPGIAGLHDLWSPKFPITLDSAIITVGSCFAQHISKAMIKRGFNWLEPEKAPDDLPKELHNENGYGIFSFRTGNIYTCALLKQYVDWALGHAEPSDEYYVEDGRYYDPFRPAISVDGFASADELFEARTRTLSAIEQAIRETDIFVFTLGLTEAWVNRSGFVYPICPGTIRGEFSPELHQFKNYSYEEVVRDLNDVFAKMRAINSDIKFLLTVSPVPLTATASSDHILTAAAYSKAVLRAAAGFLTATNEDVDYFPSYELISSHPFKGESFKSNMRSVTPEGVAHVMRQFFLGLYGSASSELGEAADHATSQGGAPVSAEPGAALPAGQTEGNPAAGTGLSTASEAGADGGVTCEDIVLESWAKGSGSANNGEPHLILVGDSHIGKLADAMRNQGVPFYGGGIMDGSKWHWMNFIPNDKVYFIPSDSSARERWYQTLESARHHAQELGSGPCTIVTNIGMHSHMFPGEFVSYLTKKYGNELPAVEVADYKTYLFNSREHHLNILTKFINAGNRVIWLSDPPVQQTDAVLYQNLDLVLCEMVANTGCQVLNARSWIREGYGSLPEEFRSGADGLHGSSLYYEALAQKIVALQKPS